MKNIEDDIGTTNFKPKLNNDPETANFKIIDLELKPEHKWIEKFWMDQSSEYPDKFSNIKTNNKSINFFNGYSLKSRADSTGKYIPIGMGDYGTLDMK